MLLLTSTQKWNSYNFVSRPYHGLLSNITKSFEELNLRGMGRIHENCKTTHLENLVLYGSYRKQYMIKFIQSSLEACQSVIFAKLLDTTLYSLLFQLLKKCWPQSAFPKTIASCGFKSVYISL